MPNPITLTINFNDPDLDPEERDEQAQQFIQELQELQDNDEIETVGRVPDLNPPDGSKPGGGFLVGMLAAEVSVANVKRLLGFLGDRLGGKPIELSVEGNGKKLTVKAHSREELEAAVKAAQEFIGS